MSDPGAAPADAGGTDPTPPVELPEAEVDALKEAGRAWSAGVAGRSAGGVSVTPGLDVTETRGRPGEKYVRVIRAQAPGFEQVAPGWLEATARATEPPTGFGKLRRRLRRTVLGPPLATRQILHERLNKVKALAVLSSDALSSVAYATEEIVVVLATAGAVAVTRDLPIMGVIALLLLVVVFSYRQTIKAYPGGGGSYIVAKDNLGPLPGLIAAAALMTDYILTVAVSIASGYDQIQSVFPAAVNFRIEACIAMVVLIALGNLRGLRESGTIFAAPTYMFIAAMFLTIGVSFVRLATGSLHPSPSTIHYSGALQPGPSLSALGGMALIFFFLRAFSSGCAAITGVEAISDGVLAFKQPQWRNARITLTIMGFLSVTMFVGITVGNHILGSDLRDSSDPCYQSVVLQQAAHAFTGPLQCIVVHGVGHPVAPAATAIGEALFIFTGVATTAILILAANTAFSDFPRLFFFLARDEYAPHQFKRLGDRLAFSNGIIVLAVLASLLLFIFHANVTLLIPLYAIGVFLAFTLSQAGMVMRWLRRREPGWRRSLPMNAIGMVMTFAVFLVTAASKFSSGAWIILLIVPTMVVFFLAIKHHYSDVAEQRTAEIPTSPDQVQPICVVPVDQLDTITMQSMAVARSLSEQVIAVHVCGTPEHMARLRARWEAWGNQVPLVIVESPYRSILRPLLYYIDAISKQIGDRTLVVVLPELVATSWWHQLLHNQFPLRLRAALRLRPGTVVVNVPYHLQKHRRDVELEAL